MHTCTHTCTHIPNCIFHLFSCFLARYKIISEIMQATTINNLKKAQGINAGMLYQTLAFI